MPVHYFFSLDTKVRASFAVCPHCLPLGIDNHFMLDVSVAALAMLYNDGALHCAMADSIGRKERTNDVSHVSTRIFGGVMRHVVVHLLRNTLCMRHPRGILNANKPRMNKKGNIIFVFCTRVKRYVRHPVLRIVFMDQTTVRLLEKGQLVCIKLSEKEARNECIKNV